MKTHFKKLQNPNFIGAWDLADKDGNYNDIIVTVTGVKKEWVHDGNGGKEELPTLHLHGYKPMVLNSTNLKAISKVAGSSFIEDWEGIKIKITVKKVKAFGEFHDALRIATKKPELPQLTPAHPKWEGAKTAIKEGNVTLDQIKKSYKISEKDEKLLTETA